MVGREKRSGTTKNCTARKKHMRCRKAKLPSLKPCANMDTRQRTTAKHICAGIPWTYGFDEQITGWLKSFYSPFGGFNTHGKRYDETLSAKEGDYFTDKLTDVPHSILSSVKRISPFSCIWNISRCTTQFRDEKIWLKNIERNWRKCSPKKDRIICWKETRTNRHRRKRVSLR